VGVELMKKNKKKRKLMHAVIFMIVVAVLAASLLACFIFIDNLPAYTYIVSVPDKGSNLIVTLEISNPLFSKTNAVSLYLGDKDINIAACVNASGKPTGKPMLEEGVLYIETGRASLTYLTYTAEVAMPGKHGSRGNISDNYAVFDGEQALLLPVNTYIYKPGSDRTPLMGKLSFEFYLPDGWDQVTPREPVENPLWSDIYAVTQDAFVFGKFVKVANTVPGLETYTLSGTDTISTETLDGFNSLYAYYTQLFGSSPSPYNIVALPKSDADEMQVIGGAGRGSVAASFDPGSHRDWHLLSHRMFHAFFDTSAPYASFHMPTNTWFYEGLATYYENVSMAALPDSLKAKLDIDVNREMALLFNNYLYMRIKNPMMFGFPPMNEEEIISNGAIEFLHYTAGPVLLKLLEDSSRANGNPPDAILKFCLDNSHLFDERFIAFEAAMELLGEDGAEAYCTSYLLSIEVPPLWYLKQYLPSDEDILAGLNNIEYVLGSWFLNIDETYHIDTVTLDQLQDAMENINDRRVLFLSVETSLTLEDYCPALYALLNDYYYRAKEKGLSFDDPELRSKMFAD